jgi:hypothetical protein
MVYLDWLKTVSKDTNTPPLRVSSGRKTKMEVEGAVGEIFFWHPRLKKSVRGSVHAVNTCNLFFDSLSSLLRVLFCELNPKESVRNKLVVLLLCF